MSKKMAGILIAYGVVLAGLGLILQPIGSSGGHVTSITAFAGGGLSVLWGVAALAGLKGRTWAILSLIAAILVLLSQTVQAWLSSSDDGAVSVTVRIIVTTMFLLTMGMLLYLFHGERPPEFYERGTARHGDSTKNASLAHPQGGRSSR